MKILELTLHNFRGFSEKTLKLSEQFTLLIGDNGTGKTAILDALAVGAGALSLGIEAMDARYIRPDEVRQISYQLGQFPNLEPQYPVSVTCSGVLDGKRINWVRSVDVEHGRTTRQNAKQIGKVAKRLQEQVRSGSEVILPVVAYYPTGRLWLQKNEKSPKTLSPGSRTQGYVDCLDRASNEKLLMRWFKTMELTQLQERQPVTVLSAAKKAVANCMEDWHQVQWEVKTDALVAESDDGRLLPFRMLSDGVRNMLAMVVDIAYRMAVLNPQMGADALAAPGLVLIDEIDLHLHPSWQRRIVEDLRRTFPNVQFVATTHSPFIVQSVRAGELINLDGRCGEYAGKSIEDIAEDEMGVPVPQRSRRNEEMVEAAKKYYAALESGRQSNGQTLEQLKWRLDELLLPYRDDPAYVAFLEMQRAAAGLANGHHDAAG